ncbi:MAG: hypothetical protein AAF193_00515 [Bacteroidota bacterium]
MVKYYWILIITIGLVACDGENDDEIPFASLNEITTQGSISNDTIFTNANQSLEFECTFTDNMELNQAKIKAIPQSTNNIHPFYTLWNEIDVQNIEGLESDVDFELNPLESTHGTYDIEITAIDDQGNQSTPIDFVWVINTDYPIFMVDSIQGASPESGFTAVLNESIALQGSLEISNGLADIQVDWILGGLISSTEVFDYSGESSLDLATLTFSAPDVAGEYELEITAEDNNGNQVTCEISASITE